jgi:hypothetical protein
LVTVFAAQALNAPAAITAPLTARKSLRVTSFFALDMNRYASFLIVLQLTYHFTNSGQIY